MKKFCKLYIRIIDGLNEKCGLIAWLILLMAFIMIFEVVARYVFNSPTRWAWGVGSQLLCVFTVMAGGYVLYHEAHIRSDLFYAKWSVKKKALVNLFTSFLPLLFCGAAVVASAKLASKSVLLREHSTTILGHPLYPIRIVIVVGAFLFLLQVIAEIMRNLLIITGNLDSGEE
jgi:TRAP-type mannitol/chloroaromatic compound transport system permease small subunit